MLVPVFATATYLLDWLFTNRCRAKELATLRRRLAQSLEGIDVDAELVELARTLLKLRRELSQAFGRVKACCGCVRPKSDEWPGGHCCSGSTQTIFTREELAALKLSGASSLRFTAPREPLCGCVFRGRAGCTLKVDCRPCLCVRYTCRELEAELTTRSDRATVIELQRQLRIAFEEFCRALNARQRWDETMA